MWAHPIHLPELHKKSEFWGRILAVSALLGAVFAFALLFAHIDRRVPLKNPSVLVSIPELALLELASDIGKRGVKGQSLEEALHLVDSLRNLRADRLIGLLRRCTRVKVIKLVRDLGESSGYEWGRDLQGIVDRMSPRKRWSSMGEGGQRLTLKP